MKNLTTKKFAISAACIVLANLFITSPAVSAQEIRFGGVTISIPKRTKTPKTEPKAETPRASGTAQSEEPKSEVSATSSRTTAATPAARPQSDPWLEIMLEEISKRKSEIEKYDPAEGGELVKPNTPDLFLPAISVRAREKFFKGVQTMTDVRKSTLNKALDSLAATAAPRLPVYKPDMTLFALRSAPLEQMMLGSLRNSATLKVHKSGIKEANWIIYKNELGIPIDRYKHGYIWARDASDDHPYCHLYTLHIQQTYTGGGSYSQTFAKLSEDTIFGCP